MNVINQEISLWPCVGPLSLDLFTQTKNFIGYFVKAPHHQYAEQLMIKVMDMFSKHGLYILSVIDYFTCLSTVSLQSFDKNIIITTIAITIIIIIIIL